MRTLLRWLGYRIVYTCEWGTYDSIYNSIDFASDRPIHRDMSVAPPWAERRIVKLGPSAPDPAMPDTQSREGYQP